LKVVETRIVEVQYIEAVTAGDGQDSQEDRQGYTLSHGSKLLVVAHG
jgi:hypothetical protein